MGRKPTRDMQNIGIYQTPSGAERYRVRIRTRAETKTKSFVDLEDARLWRNRQQEPHGQRAPNLPEASGRIPAMALGVFIKEVWWEEYALPNLAEKTRKNYASHFKNWILPSPIAGIEVAKVDAEHIHDWRDWSRREGARDDSIRSALKVISSAFTWGAKRPRRTGIKGNPVTEWPSERRQHQVVIVDQEVIERLRQAILRGGRGDALLRQRDALLLSVMAQTGMRPQEARMLKVKNVGQTEIDLTETKTGTPRLVPLWAPLANDIDVWTKVAGLSGDDPLIPAKAGQHLTASGWNSWVKETWHPVREGVASLPQVNNPLLRRARAYDVCRHSYAAQQLAALMPLPNLAAVLGHSVEVLANNYAAAMPAPADPRIDPEQAVVAARAKVEAEFALA